MTFYLQCMFIKHLNCHSANCRFHVSQPCETIACVFSKRKPRDEHIFFISFSDWQIKGPCQEKLNETTINTVLQGAFTHTMQRGDEVWLPGANNNQLMLIQYACTHTHTHTCAPQKHLICKCIFFFFFSNRDSISLLILRRRGRGQIDK